MLALLLRAIWTPLVGSRPYMAAAFSVQGCWRARMARLDRVVDSDQAKGCAGRRDVWLEISAPDPSASRAAKNAGSREEDR